MLLVNPSKGAQKVTQRRPKAFDGVNVYLTYAVPILVSCPLAITVTDGLSVSFDLAVAFPFVGVDRCMVEGASMNMRTQALSIGTAEHPQAHLSTLSTDSADDWGAVVLIRSVSLRFVSSPAWRILRIGVELSFFPPRFETSRRSRFARRAAVSPAGAGWHSPGAADGSHAPSSGSDPALGPSETCFCPEQRRAKAERPLRVGGDALRRPSRCRACMSGRTPCSARPAVGCSLCGGSGRPLAKWSHNADTEGPPDGNVVGARFDSDRGRQHRREENPCRHRFINLDGVAQEIGPAPPLHSFWT